MQDSEIVSLFLLRDENAVAQTERTYGAYCRYIAVRILQNASDAEECVNDALHAAWNSIPPQEPQNLKAYIGKLTRTAAISRFRREHAEKRADGHFAASLDEIDALLADDSFDSSLDSRLLSAAISSFLRTVKKEERNIFVRRYWYNDSVAEIAERFGYGKTNVRVMLSRTRAKLGAYLKKEGLLE